MCTSATINTLITQPFSFRLVFELKIFSFFLREKEELVINSHWINGQLIAREKKRIFPAVNQNFSSLFLI